MKWTIPYAGREWTFNDDRITASEARLQKRLSGGLRPLEADAARLELDPDAWIAGLAIARKRDGLPVEEAIDIDDDDLEIAAIFERTKETVEAEAAASKARAEQTDDGRQAAADTPADSTPATAAAEALPEG